nr:MAG TPA: hypothetical protein [Caudoviricetes sp.]
MILFFHYYFPKIIKKQIYQQNKNRHKHLVYSDLIIILDI